MKVYLLQSNLGYDGMYVISVHASERSAEEAAVDFMRENPDRNYALSSTAGCFAEGDHDMSLEIDEFELRY